jgi:site-specific DNA-methyltransferase (adenine-specific)
MTKINEILCGNHLDVLKEYPAGFFDMVLTSPPYDNLREYKGYTFEFEPLAHELYRVLKDGGVCVWVVNDATINGSETLTSFRQAIYFKDVVGFNVHDTMIYETDKPPMNARRYQACFEYMFVLSKGKVGIFNPLKVKSSRAGSKKMSRTFRNNDGTMKKTLSGNAVKSERIKESIWYIQSGFCMSSNDTSAFKHPATFPEKLAEDHILSWSNPGDIILDPMCGSGTTCKMAVKHQRHYVGIDCAEEYCDIARRRLEKFTAQITVFDVLQKRLDNSE